MIALQVLLWMMISLCVTIGFVIVRYVVLNTPAEMITAWKNLSLLSLVLITGWLLAVGLGMWIASSN